MAAQKNPGVIVIIKHLIFKINSYKFLYMICFKIKTKKPKKEKEKMKKENEEIIDYGSCANCDKKLTQMGALLWDSSGVVCNDCDMSLMVVPNLNNYYGIKDDE